MKKITALILLSASLIFGQLEEIQQIKPGDGPTNYERSYVFQNSDLFYYFYRQEGSSLINVAFSEDGGITWNNLYEITDLTYASTNPRSFDIIQTGSTNFIFGFLKFSGVLQLYGYDILTNTLTQIGSDHIINSNAREIELTKIDELTFLVSFKDIDGNLFYLKTDDGAETWSEKLYFPGFSTGERAINVTLQNGNLYAVQSDNKSINIITGTIDPAGWSVPFELYVNDNPISNAAIYSNGDELFLVFEEALYDNITKKNQTDVCYLISSDNGSNWGNKIKYTTFIEDDYISEVTFSLGDLIITTLSNRGNVNSFQTYFGKLNYTIDPAPPMFYWREQPRIVDYNTDFGVRVFINDETGFSSVTLEFNNTTYKMYDDGNHNDSLAGDYIFGATIDGYPKNTSFYPSDTYYIDINNFGLPIKSNGVLADVNVSSALDIVLEIEDLNSNKRTFSDGIAFGEWGTQGKYEGNPVLFSGGFYLSGYTNDQLWANGVASSDVIEDYQPGLVGSDPNDGKNLIYPVYEGDSPFGKSWQNWKNAVDNGAYFYDGDGDGIYNPVDENKNGVWDSNEDKPDLLYDAVLYTVYNDGVPSSERRYSEVEPQGIEIRQSIYVSKRNSILDDVIFIRYSLNYKGLGNENEPDSLENLIFSVWNDADIGDAVNDLTGCDTTLQAGYTYDGGEDYVWENEAPAVYKVILQGPRVKTDDPNSVAYNKLGPDLGIETYNGYKNLGMTTFAPPHKNVDPLMDPRNPLELRRYQNALYPRDGAEVDPCDFEYGEVLGGVNCADVYNKYWYSGDPVTQYGWLQTNPVDMRDLTNTGSFTLKKGEPIDIIIAYVIGKGTDALNSITRAREITQYVHEEYERNFSTIVGVEDKPDEVVNKYSLSQNYPNPFNPTTTIKFSILHSQFSTLKVYDILGREVTTLVNEVKSPGTYEVEFNASQLASGVYFYRLTAGDFMQTKKMMLLK